MASDPNAQSRILSQWCLSCFTVWSYIAPSFIFCTSSLRRWTPRNKVMAVCSSTYPLSSQTKLQNYADAVAKASWNGILVLSMSGPESLSNAKGLRSCAENVGVCCVTGGRVDETIQRGVTALHFECTIAKIVWKLQKRSHRTLISVKLPQQFR